MVGSSTLGEMGGRVNWGMAGAVYVWRDVQLLVSQVLQYLHAWLVDVDDVALSLMACSAVLWEVYCGESRCLSLGGYSW